MRFPFRFSFSSIPHPAEKGKGTAGWGWAAAADFTLCSWGRSGAAARPAGARPALWAGVGGALPRPAAPPWPLPPSSPNRKKPPPRREQPFLLQLFVVGTDILIVPVLHPEALGNGTQLDKAQPLVEVPGVQVGGYYGINCSTPKPCFLPSFRQSSTSFSPMCSPRASLLTA